MTQPAVQALGIHVYYGQFQVLDNIHLEAPEGAFVALIGPNGAGKSTLLNVLLGLQTPNAGKVKLFGGAPQALPPKELGYIPQLKTLDRTFPTTALELVTTGLSCRWPWRIGRPQKEAALAAMTMTGVENVADRMIAQLSGGELQRVYLARCLVRKPKLLILDEPAAGMDVVGEADMYHLLEKYQQQTGATIFMITHDWEGARIHATHVLLLNRRVIGYGPAAEIAREEHLLQAFGHAGHAEATHAGDAADA